MAKAKAYDVHTIGKRKTSVARVYMSQGTGKIRVNDKPASEYFMMPGALYIVMQPFELLKMSDRYDLNINVCGGGPVGQAGAVRLGISRALVALNQTLRPELKKAGFLTRDSREVERKKYGVRGARRAFQFSKR
jgi:small subunit ribosomal protein S9